MLRRNFLAKLGGLSLLALAPRLPRAANPAAGAPRYDKALILVELKGGNDGLNTVVPYAQPEYYALRPRIAVKREDVVQLDERTGLHPSLQPLLPLWQARELAIIQGVGYPNPNLSHFRSIEIWDTASKSEEYLHEGWLTRAFTAAPTPRRYAADGVIIGSHELGPLSGAGSRAIALASTDQFLRQARLAAPAKGAAGGALAHIMKVESDIAQAATHIAGSAGQTPLRTEFPKGEFGNALKTACQVIAGSSGVAVLRLSLNGFDTHQNQPGTQAGLLKQFAEGLAALRAALLELGRWNDTLILTYAEFGRRAQENRSNGTDHGTANAHFATGGRIRGGLYGAPPNLRQLDGNGNLGFAVDFRSIYATALERWWNVASPPVLGGRFAPLDIIKA
jgi:uncharacterized protein (DUF1501 family)